MKRTEHAPRPRKRPVQARSKQTVEWLLVAAARVFHQHGLDATTNRIAAAAGVSIGTLYEYFPNKQALLLALAERHVSVAERGIAAALSGTKPIDRLLAALQAAVVASHEFPSQALERVADPHAPELRQRSHELREQVLVVLHERANAAGLPEPAVRARTAFGLAAELSSRVVYEPSTPSTRAQMLRHLLTVAVEQYRA
jgi:AcrR family transcriptional regulator